MNGVLKNKVFFGIDKNALYPSDEWFFSPSHPYPEYPYKDIAKEDNIVYSMVREGFISLGLDKKTMEHLFGIHWGTLFNLGNRY